MDSIIHFKNILSYGGQGRMAEWLACKTHDLMIAGLRLTAVIQ